MNHLRQLNEETRDRIQRILGYLNFSSGAEDVRMLSDLSSLFKNLHDPNSSTPTHEHVHEVLTYELKSAGQSNKALADPRQVSRALDVTFNQILPAYLVHHRDLLFHRGSETLFNAFFVGRVFEIVLQLQESNIDDKELVLRVIGKLNDFIGHRPVAVLESQKLEPYEHEWVRPIPIYIREAGVVHCLHSEVIQSAIDQLFSTDADLLERAQFDPALMDELAVDPRSFDFDHPVNKRPNHHFGQWDEHHIDNQGRYRRFVIHQVTLDALTSRVEEPESENIPRDELVFEAGAVLAGTILMAAGICGWGPNAHDSTVTLPTLLPIIAQYRDRFYANLLSRLDDPHRSRLVKEANIRQQPFGAARQHLNRQLARYRAFQMVHVNLALIFSRMGYDQAAIRHANILPVASARMICQIECLLYSGSQSLDHDDLPRACETLPRLFDQLKRAVNCGAIIDPWNIIGFDANYNLFSGNQNAVHDQRADDLIYLMDQIFCFASQVWIAAQAANQAEVCERVKTNFEEIVNWWHKFAVHEVRSVESVAADEIFAATRDVAGLLGQWQDDGAQSGDVQFWANHAHSFMSPRTYILAIDCLIERREYVTSMALLIHWLTQSDFISLQQSSGSFQSLVAKWVTSQRDLLTESQSAEDYCETWKRIRKFSDYVEANAGEWWEVPRFELRTTWKDEDEEPANAEPKAPNDEADDDSNPYEAAYEGVVYRGSDDDGIEGSIHDGGSMSEEAIHRELQRISDRLAFLQALSDYWYESIFLVNEHIELSTTVTEPDFHKRQRQKIDDWARQSDVTCKAIEKLIKAIQGYPLPTPDGSTDSLAEYDRQRLYKESLLDQAIRLKTDTTESGLLLTAVAKMLQQKHDLEATESQEFKDHETKLWIQTLSCLLAVDQEGVREALKLLVEEIADKPLLLEPLSKGGNPLQIVDTRLRKNLISLLLENLPRLGMLRETRDLLHVALMMERSQTVRSGAVTEFDDLFRIGYSSMVERLIHAHKNERSQTQSDQRDSGEQDAEPKSKVATGSSKDSDEQDATDNDKDPSTEKSLSEKSLFDSLEMLAESMLLLWLSHSKTLRLSVLEKVRDEESWEQLVVFIKRFGKQIFTHQFLNLSNIRAILHQGVDRWLRTVEEEGRDDLAGLVVQEIQEGYPWNDAVKHMTCVLEAIIENFNEYRDYNSTTTQSDDGRLLFMFLDFLRLQCRYEQLCWNLKPVFWAHESLVRLDEHQVARLWRRLLADRVNPEANKLLVRLKDLQEKYSIQMATVSQRLNERFAHPMHVDRLVALVPRAMKDPLGEESQRAFDMIENYAESLTQQPIAVGFDLPDWINALQTEVENTAALFSIGHERECSLVTQQAADLKDIRDQLEQMPRRS